MKYLVTDDEPNFALVQHRCVQSEGLIGDDEDWAWHSQTMLRYEVD